MISVGKNGNWKLPCLILDSGFYINSPGLYLIFTDAIPAFAYNISMDSSSLLPVLQSILTQQNAAKSGQSASNATSAQKALQDFNTMLRVSMEEQLTSMIASFNSDDSSDSDSSSSDSSSLLGGGSSGLSGMSSLFSQLSSSLGSSGSAGDTSSLINTLMSGNASGASGGTASILSSLLSGQNSSSGASSLFNSLSSADNLMGLSSLSGLGSSTTGDLFGSSSTASNAIPGVSNTSYEQLLAQQVLKDYQSANPNGAAVLLPMNAQAAHINQFEAELQAGGAGVNTDCGPTSLVMALHELGLGVAGETTSSTAGQAINLARLSMANTPAKDGIDAQGNYSAAEHNTFTDFEDIKRGAQAAGATTLTVAPNASDIMHALQEGGRVIATGTFTGKSPLPWTGDRGFDNQTAPGNAAGHFVEVSSYDPFTKLFTINDPARSAPHQVSAATLEYFMSGNAGAMAIRS
jgi:hypothetical protein